MVLKKKSVSLSGRNENSTTWSVDLEIPLFGIEKVDLFYGSVCEAVLERAKRDGLNVFSFLTPCYVGEEAASVYIDLLYCRGRILVDLYRFADNRSAFGNVLPSPRGAENGGWYRHGCKYYTFKSLFRYDPEREVKRKEYRSYISERELKVGKIGKGAVKGS